MTNIGYEGVSLCTGAINLIQGSAYRQTAVQIGGAEAYHAAIIRSLLYQNLDAIPGYGLTTRQITNAILKAVNSIAGPPQLQFPIVDEQTSAIANVDSSGELTKLNGQS